MCQKMVALGLCFGVMTPISTNANFYYTPITNYYYNYNYATYYDRDAELTGLPENIYERLYVNGYETEDEPYYAYNDNKRLYYTDDRTRLVNYTDGYQMDFGANAAIELSHSPLQVKLKTWLYEATVSYEKSPYWGLDPVTSEQLQELFPDTVYKDGVEQYITYYLNRFLLNDTYMEENNLVRENHFVWQENGLEAELITVKVNDLPSGVFDGYGFLTIRDSSAQFLRVIYKYDSGRQQELIDEVSNNFKTFRKFTPVGQAVYKVNYEPILPTNWTEETRALYENISNNEKMDFGIFTRDMLHKGISETIPYLEEELNYSFPYVLHYCHLPTGFPLEFMQENYNNGKYVELTYQITTTNNENLFGYTPQLDIYRGLLDEEIREFARGAKEFGKPFLFRLNNEMNSDWTSYSGVVNLSDPEIYIAVYQRIYDIFQEEGVNNCIWIFNPNDRDCPPMKWNSSLNYYPGNEYVHMLGVTGYNNGTYYAKYDETWREFDHIYDEIHELYYPFFDKFSWIITEFSSSSYGGDKVNWINNMFHHLDRYPNIKMAVWFSFADYDEDGVIARPYFLDETPETLEAFRIGLEHYYESSNGI